MEQIGKLFFFHSDIILIVDDQPANLKVLLFFLQEKNFELRILQSGMRALDMLRDLTPDIILLDILMPGMDGFEICKKIKANKRLADIPVIFMTALDTLEDKVAGFEAGGVDYMGLVLTSANMGHKKYSSLVLAGCVFQEIVLGLRKDKMNIHKK
ncbi:MAG: response regulator [Gammaproteobacteria bacterium]|nr:response regulator [Gammaproteobacteria bacterium]